MRGFPRTTLLSAMLGLVSAGGSISNCAMNHFGEDDKPTYKMAETGPHFCYNTLGEISCYAAPQANMGPVVAMEPERIADTSTRDEDIKATVADDLKAPVSLKATPASTAPAAAAAAMSAPIPNPPSTSLNPPKAGFPAEPLSLSPDYPQSTAMPPASTIGKPAHKKTK